MDIEEFRKHGHEMVDWMADYFANVESFPVLPDVQPGDIFAKIGDHPPLQGEPYEQIFKDFKQQILPGITHWESPNFMAYFPGNKSKASVLAEMLTATLGSQCMMWLTSPAAAELEEKMMIWLQEMLGLSPDFTGTIHDTASTATLCALLTAREKVTNFAINEKGFSQVDKLTIYCSDQVHSSIEKGAKIAGYGREQVRKVGTDHIYALRPDLLREAIEKDLASGYRPTCVVSALGTTGTTAIDPIDEISDICLEYGIWHHVDAAYAGTALIVPEMRWMAKGADKADSFVFNPHKWMFTNFDCTAYYVKDPVALINTFAILPDYLKTSVDGAVKNYRDWGIQLGRRFRALKLWFVIREMGVEEMRRIIRNQIALGDWLAKEVESHTDFELLAPVPLNTLCFRFKPDEDEPVLDALNQQIMERINKTGKLFFMQMVLDGRFSLRLAFGNMNVERRHVENAWNMIQQEAILVYEEYKQSR